MKKAATLALFVAALGVTLAGQGANEAAAARRLAAIRLQPPALEAFLREMPKGGDLHNHLSGAIYAESYIRWAAGDNLCVAVATFSFVQGPCDPAAGRPTAAAVLADSVLYGQTIDAMSMRNWPAGVNGHDHFFAAFGKFGAVSGPHAGDELAEVAARAASEHVSYLELMITPDGGVSQRLGRAAGWHADFGDMRAALLGSGWADVATQTRQRLDSFEARQRAVLKCGTPAADAGCAVTIRYVAQVSRAAPRQEVFAQIMAGMDLQGADARVVGVNLVQPEDAPVAVQDFDLQMAMIDFLHGSYPDAHISLHAGELTDGLVPPETLRSHIRSSVERGHAERIGHGVDVMNEDDPYGLLREMAARKVLVEINLSSNASILGVSGARHPLRLYLQYGVPVAISTDDYGVARSSDTLEWLRAVQEQGLDYYTIKRLVRNSIDYAFVDATTKTQLKRDLENAFRTFEQQYAAH